MATEMKELNATLRNFHGEFSKTLPSHITPEQFHSVAVTAIQNSPELLMADRRSLLNALRKSAQDGLLPDGREGALVIFNTNTAKSNQPPNWIQKVQWMPMIGGILKKVRQSGQVAFITARCVYDEDEFDFWLDEDGEHLKHRPAFGDSGKVRLVYAMAKTKDGTVYVEVLTVKDIEKIRAASKSSNSPAWKNWWEGMSESKALRKLSKRLPLSPDLLSVIQRDDENMLERDVTPKRAHKSAAAMLQGVPDEEEFEEEPEQEVDPFTGEYIDHQNTETTGGETNGNA